MKPVVPLVRLWPFTLVSMGKILGNK
ncbi:protein of unknown function [Magnetospirillum sp. XM-1]|nr:protein of unknown function [Magnetospirillum sp. XM-1]